MALLVTQTSADPAAPPASRPEAFLLSPAKVMFLRDLNVDGRRPCRRSGTGILPVRSCGIGILPMIPGLEGAPNAEFCVGDPKPMPRESGSHLRAPNAL